MAKQLNVNLAFTADTGKAKAQLQDLQKSLNSLTTKTNGLGITQDIVEATNEVAKLQAILEQSKSATGGLDLGKFNQSLKQSEIQISDYAKTLSSLGPAGDQAFAQLAKSVIYAEVPLKRTSTILNQFKTTLANTARWQFSSSILHGFMGSVQQALGYAQDLNESLNNIRIVTGNSVNEMAAFAQQANKAAKALSATTTEYTNASLIYYQQGLNDQQVKERTDITIKMANVSRQSAEVVSDQMTAVWNNFYDGSQSLEHYADAMTKLGADTASSSDEIAQGLEKFAAIGDTIGLSFDNAAAALATVTATTRQSADVVGTAFKTIFARIQGLSLGETLDDGTNLNKYSEALDKVGISIFEQNGELKDMDNILSEMGAKWKDLNKDQQVALAQTVAGVRQYNQLVALMDNFDFYEQNLASAQTADGTLQKQADIYAESWEAARDRVTAASEEIYNQLLNDKFFIDLNNGFAGFLNILSNTIDGLGGLPGVLLVASSLMIKLFGKEMSTAIDNWGYNIKLRSKEGIKDILDFRHEAIKALKTMYADNVDTGPINSVSESSFMAQADLADQLLIKQQELLAKGTALSEIDKQRAQNMIKITEELGEQAITSAKQLEIAQRQGEELEGQLQIHIRQYNRQQTDPSQKINISKELESIKKQQIQYSSLEATFKKLVISKKNFTSSDDIIKELTQMSTAAQDAGLDFSHFEAILSKISKGTSVDDALNFIEQEMYQLGDAAYDAIEGTEGLRQTLTNTGMSTEQINSILDKLYASWVQQGIITEEVAQKLKQVGANAEYAKGEIAGMQGPPPSFGQQIIAVANLLSNITMAINSIKGLLDTWSNEELSFGDKIISTFTTLGMVIPLVTLALKGNNLAMLGSVSASLATAMGFNGVAISAKVAAGGVGALWAALWPIALVAAIVTAAIAAVVAIAKALADTYNADALAAERAEQGARNLAEAYNECKQEYEDMISAMEEYQTARDGLDSLTKGTEEYKEALKEANHQALELINKYGLIEGQDYNWSGDQLVINDKALNRVQNEKENELDTAYAASQMAGIEARRARAIADQTELRREMRDDAGIGDGDQWWKGALDILAGLSLDVLTMGASGGLGTMTAAASIANRAGMAESYDAVINKAVKESQTNQDLFISKGLMAKELNLNDQALIDALWENKDSIQQLSADMNAAAQAEKLAAQNAANEIMSESGYDKTKAGQMALEAGGEIYQQLYGDAYDKYKADVENRGLFNTGTDASKAAFEEYAKQAGLDQLKKFEVTNYKGDGTVEYKYIDEDGQEQVKIATAEEIAATLAAADAAKQLEGSLSQLRTTITTLNNSSDAGDRALAEFLSQGNLEGATKAEYEDILADVGASRDENGNLTYDSAKIDSLLGLTGDATKDLELAKSRGYESAEAYRNAFIQSLDIEWRVPEGIGESIANSLSVGAANNIQNAFEELGAEGGKAFVDTINTIASGADWEALTPDEQTAMLDEIANIDWSSWEAGDQAVKIAEKYGIAIDAASEAWQNNINAMRDAANALPDLQLMREEFEKIKEITEDIDLGSILSEEDYNTLVQYNKELEKYFAILADGSAQFIGDKLDFQQDINNQHKNDLIENIQHYKDRNAEINSQINAGFGIVGDTETLDNLRASQAYQKENGKYEYGSEASQQLDFLESQNYNAEQLNAWRQDLADGNTTVKVLEEIAQAVNSTADSFNALGEEAKKNTGLIQGMMNEIALGADDAAERADLLASGVINEEAFGYAAIAAHNEEKWEDIDPEEVEEYADSLMDAAEASSILSDELKNNEEAAEDVALYTKKMNKGIESLQEGFSDWSSILKKSDSASQEYAEAMGEMKSAMSDVLGVSEDFLSDDFIIKNMADIEKAALGDAAAIDRLAIAAGRDILVNVDIQDENVLNEVLALHDQLAAEIPDIEVGATLNDGEFLSKAAQIVEAAGMSVEQANAYFRSMGFEPHFETKEIDVTRVPQGTRTYRTVTQWADAYDTSGNVIGSYPSVIEENTESFDLAPVVEKMEVPALTTDGGEPNFTLTRTNSGSMNNFSGSNSGGKTPTKSGGSAKKAPKKSDVVDRYKETNDALDDMADALEDANKQADRLYGQSRINKLKEANKAIEQEVSLLKQKRSEAESYLAIDKQLAQAKAQELGFTLQFDGSGLIQNYTTVLSALYEKIAANPGNEDLQEKINELKDLISQYDETRELIEDIDNQIDDKYNEWQDNNYEQLHYALEIEIELNELELEKLDYYLDKIADDFYSMAEAAQYMTNKIPQWKDSLSDYEAFYEKIGAAYDKGEISQAAYVEGLKETHSAILDNLSSLNELDKEMMHYYGDTLDAASEELSYYTDQLSNLTSVLEHYKNIVALVHGEYDFKRVETILKGQAATIKNELDVATANYKMLEAEKAAIEASYEAAADPVQKELLKEELKNITTALSEAQEEMLSMTEAWGEAMQAIMQNTMDAAAHDLEAAFTSGMGFDSLSSSLDRLVTFQDEYLTKTNQLYETQKMMRTAQQASDKTDNEAAKLKFKNYISEIQQLQEKDQLSQLDLEIAQARYDLLLAEIALTEAQNAKSTVRLQRDNEGNFGYVYTADQEAVSAAEQELADAENALYNIGLQATNEYGQKRIELQQQLADELIALNERRAAGEFETDELFYAERDRIISEYNNLFIAYSNQYTTALGVDANIQKDAWVLAYQEMIDKTADWKDSTNTYLDETETAYENYRHTIESESEIVSDVLDDVEGNVKEVTDESDNLAKEVTDDVIPALEDELAAVRNVTSAYAAQRSEIQSLISYYEDLVDSIRGAINEQARLDSGGDSPDFGDGGSINSGGGPSKNSEASSLATEAQELVKRVHYGEIGGGGAWKAPAKQSGYSDEAISIALKAFNNSKEGAGYDYYYEEALRLASSYDTGGYTGAWGPEGRLAMLHEKELILNKVDTENFLAATEILRSISNAIDLQALHNHLSLSSNSFGIPLGGAQQLEQTVTIEANFPNVQDRNEIQEAFNNLVNKASQYANRKK